ncbi:hypothetical protein GCM10027074_60550 [Streptomyces deserti]
MPSPGSVVEPRVGLAVRPPILTPPMLAYPPVAASARIRTNPTLRRRLNLPGSGDRDPARIDNRSVGPRTPTAPLG